MKKLLCLILLSLFLFFSSCEKHQSEANGTKTSTTTIDLNKIMPQNEDFAGEPLLVLFKEKIECKNFEEFKNLHLKNQPPDKQKVISMIIDEIKGFQKSVTGVYVEHSNNVTFSIVYLLFDNSRNAKNSIQYLQNLYTELIGQEFKEINEKRILGDDQKVLYTLYSNIPIYLAFYRRDNIVVLLFVPVKSVFHRVFPVSSIYLPMKDGFYIYNGLPNFAKVKKPAIAELKVPTDDYYIPNTSMLRELAEERSKQWMDYFKKYSSNALRVAQEFFAFSDKRLMDFALAFVDFRFSENLIPQKYPEWYTQTVEKRIGNNIKLKLIAKNPVQPRYSKIHFEGGVRYQYPKLGQCDYDFQISGSKGSGRVRITFSVFGNYLKVVDIKFI